MSLTEQPAPPAERYVLLALDAGVADAACAALAARAAAPLTPLLVLEKLAIPQHARPRLLACGVLEAVVRALADAPGDGKFPAETGDAMGSPGQQQLTARGLTAAVNVASVLSELDGEETSRRLLASRGLRALSHSVLAAAKRVALLSSTTPQGLRGGGLFGGPRDVGAHEMLQLLTVVREACGNGPARCDALLCSSPSHIDDDAQDL